MIVGFKDIMKLVGIFIVTACAVFVCTLFLNYNMDLTASGDSTLEASGRAMYEAQLSMGKVTCAVTGGCLVLTSAVMLMFYVKNYIDSHKRELGILKALGYSSFEMSLHFLIFGLSVFIGASIGFLIAWGYMPHFYSLQNAEGFFDRVTMNFHFSLILFLILIPTAVFSLLAVLYAKITLKMPAIDLLKDKNNMNLGKISRESREEPFLKSVKRGTLKEKKLLVFFMAFSAFCFSAMTQMSMSMDDLASDSFAGMIITIGLTLAFTTLFMVLTTVIKANAKTLAMMRIYGYDRRECSSAVLGAYRPVTYVGFAVGTVYQYVLLKAVLAISFSEIDVPEYSFDIKAMIISLIAFIITYEAVMILYSAKINRQSPKTVMSE